METDTKQSIEEIAEQLLIWKVKGGEKLPCCPAKEPKLFSDGIQHLIDKDYLVPIWDSQECLDYLIMPKGINRVYN